MRRAAILLACLATACGGAAPPVEEPDEPEDEAPETWAVALRLEDGGMDENETPRTRVVLVAIEPDGARGLTELEVETGACWHVEGEGAVLIAARCWWAGAGGVYALSREGDAVIARRRSVDELDEPGEWVEMGRVEIPEDANLQVLAPGRSVALPGE